MKNTHAIKSLVAAALFSLANLAAAELVVVVNPKSPLASMTADQVSAIFLGKTSTLPSGGTATPVDLPESSAARDQFYSKAAGKTSAQVKATWARLTFSGKATPPKELGSAADVKKFVASNPDAIGYIEKSAVDGSVKAILTID